MSGNRSASDPDNSSQSPVMPRSGVPGSITSLDIGLSEFQQQYRAVFEASSDGLVITDLDTECVIDANPAFCRMHGYENMDGIHPSTFIHPDSHHLFGEYLQTIRNGHEYRCQARDIRKDGSIFDVEVIGRSFLYGGRPAILGIVRDITDRLRDFQVLEERVAERTREIERRREVAEGLRDLLATVNSRRTLDEIMQYVVQQTCNLLNCDAASVFIADEDEEFGEALIAKANMGLEPELMDVRLPVGQSSTGLAYKELRPVIVPDIRAALPAATGRREDLGTQEHSNYIAVHHLPEVLETSDLSRPEDPGALLRSFAESYGALLAVPLAVKDERYGVLSLYYRGSREFTEDEVALAEAFADQTALAIENARLREQAEKAAAIEERQWLARELHDAVTQTLFSATLIADVIPEIWEVNPDAARGRLEQLRRLTRGALAEMRLLLVELRPGVLGELSLTDLLKQLADAAAGTTGAEVSVRCEGPSPTRLPANVQVALYRIAQEALNNIAKHARATHVSVELHHESDGRVTLRIEDNGQGFDTGTNTPGHLGLSIMCERAQDIGALFRLDSTTGNGTRITVNWRNGGWTDS
ncbi:MAG: PAS domain S-box protein [Thermomicrobiales bacterium]